MARKPGPPPIPDEIHRRRGTHGEGWRVSGAREDKGPLLKPGLMPEKPLRVLGKEGRASWDRIRAWSVPWMAESDVERVQAYCETMDLYHAHQTAARLGKWSRLDPVDQKRQYDVLRDLRKQVTDGLAELGFTPADRTRLGVSEVEHLDDLEAFRREQGIA